MAGRVILGACVVLFATPSTVQAGYPTAYPLENESIVPPPVVAAMPTYTYDDSDPGGYCYHHAYTLTELKLDGTMTFWNGTIAHMQASYDVAPFYEVIAYNCTVKGKGIIDADSFLSTLAGVEVCKPGECCPMLWGSYAYQSSTVSEGDYDWEGSMLTDGLCDGVYSHIDFCTIFDRLHSTLCIEYIKSDMERTWVGPCHDSLFRFFTACKLYKNTGYEWDRFLEPEAYWKVNTAEEMNAHYAVLRRADKVCQPYSYYHPETAKESSEASAAGSSSPSISSSSATDASSESSGVLAIFSAVFVVCALFL